MMPNLIRPMTGLLLGATLLTAFTGCVGYVATPPPPVYVDPVVVVEGGYVYYPRYQVYYSNSRRHFIYPQGRSWVSRPQPPRASVDVVFASPSVHLGFHDAPSRHHAEVVRQYPKHWAPPREKPHHGDGDNRGGRR